MAIERLSRNVSSFEEKQSLMRDYLSLCTGLCDRTCFFHEPEWYKWVLSLKRPNHSS